MRDTLENLYFGNITPNDQIVKSGTALKKAMEQSAECEEKLTALLEDKEKTLLLRLINAENEIGSTMALENFILGFRLGVSPKKKQLAEYLRENPGVSNKSYLARQLGMAMTTVQRYYDEVRAELRGEESPVPQM